MDKDNKLLKQICVKCACIVEYPAGLLKNLPREERSHFEISDNYVCPKCRKEKK